MLDVKVNASARRYGKVKKGNTKCFAGRVNKVITRLRAIKVIVSRAWRAWVYHVDTRDVGTPVQNGCGYGGGAETTSIRSSGNISTN